MAMAKKQKLEGVSKTELGTSQIESTIRDIQTKYGEGAIMKLGEKPKVNIGSISTGSLGLDYALGVGGLPQ